MQLYDERIKYKFLFINIVCLRDNLIRSLFFLQEGRLELHVLPFLDRHMDLRDTNDSRGSGRKCLRLLYHSIYGGKFCYPHRLYFYL